MLHLSVETNAFHPIDQDRDRRCPYEGGVSIRLEKGHEGSLLYVLPIVQALPVVRALPRFLQHHPKANNRLNRILNWRISSNLLRPQGLNHRPLFHLPPVGQPIRPQPSVTGILQEDTAAILLLNWTSSIDARAPMLPLLGRDLR